MPIDQASPAKPFVQGGHADFMLRSDYLRQTPQAYAQFMKTYGGKFTFMDMLQAIGNSNINTRSEAVQSPFYDYYFEDEDIRRFAIGSVVTAQGGAGDDLVVALAAAEMITLNGRRTSRPRKDETIIDKNGKNWSIKSKNINTNPHQLTLTPKVATTALTGAANDVFIIIGPSYAEGTGQPKGLVTDYGRYTNRFAIMKETDITTGTNMTTKQPWAPIKDLQGYAYLKGIERTEIRHNENKSMMMVHGQLGDDNVLQSVPDFDTEAPSNDTEGLLQAYFTSGKGMSYDKATGYDLADLQRVTAWYRGRRLPQADILAMQGGGVASLVSASLFDMFKTYNMNSFLSKKYMNRWKYSSAERYTSEDYFLEIGFRGVGIDGYNIMFREITELNGLYGEGYTAGFDYEGLQLFLPITTIRDPKNNVDIPTIQALHRGQEVGGYQRSMELWNTGGAGPIRKTDEWDVQRTFLRSEFMLALAGHKWLVYQQSGSVDA